MQLFADQFKGRFSGLEKARCIILQQINKLHSDIYTRHRHEIFRCADGLMELNAFVQLVSEFRREGDSEEEILEAFRVFDPEFSGVVSATQFRQVMVNYGERLCEEDVDELVSLADVDRKGNIRYMGQSLT